MDRRNYSIRPLILDAREAHAAGTIRYCSDGTCILAASLASQFGKQSDVTISTDRQFPLIRATFDDLNKALSRLSNSPRVDGGPSLREQYDAEVARYEALASQCLDAGGWEPDYGSYVFDHYRGDLYLIAPRTWHRIALVTSNSNLLRDADDRLTWHQKRSLLEQHVVGVAGVSVGGNVLEGWLREARPNSVKIADPDWVELTNLNRGERMSIRHAATPRSARFDPRNPHDITRISKAEYMAYEQHLVDPYLEIFVYSDGLTRSNLEQFMGGNGSTEPPLSVLAEEMDDMKLKLHVRDNARRKGIDVLMMSDFGHSAHAMWNFFNDDRNGPLGVGTSDDELYRVLARIESGERDQVKPFIEGLCGRHSIDPALAAFLAGRGEQPTASVPQSGATAMASGAIGGKEIALRALGRRGGTCEAVSYDLDARVAARDGLAL